MVLNIAAVARATAEDIALRNQQEVDFIKYLGVDIKMQHLQGQRAVTAITISYPCEN